MKTTILSATLIALYASAAFAHEDYRGDQNQYQGQYQKSTSRATSTSGSNTVVAQENLSPASTAFAAPLAVGSDSCMGSTSAGGQGVGFGLSLGSTWHDDACERRHDAVTLHNLGENAAAIALMCQDDHVAKAMALAGRPCPANESDAGDQAEAWPTTGKAIDR